MSSAVYSGSIVISDEGITTIKYFSIDNVGNAEAVKTAANTVKIDKTIPTVSYSISPSSPNGENGWYVTQPTVTLTAEDPMSGGSEQNEQHEESKEKSEGVASGVSRIEYRLNGADEWTVYESPFILVDGVWTIEYRSFDNATNQSLIGAANAKVDTIAPGEVNLLNARYDGDIYLEWDVDNTDTHTVRIYRGSSANFTLSGNLWNTNPASDDDITDNNPDLGKTYYYKVVAFDEAGNRSPSEGIKVQTPNEEGGEAIITSLGTTPAADEEVLGATTENNEGGQGGEATSEDQGDVLGASTENGQVNSFMDFVKKNWWWLLIILLILGYITRRQYEQYQKSKTQNPLV
jgi:hypothetical protein